MHLYSCAHSFVSVWAKRSTAHIFLRIPHFLNVYLLFASHFAGTGDNKKIDPCYRPGCVPGVVYNLSYEFSEPYGENTVTVTENNTVMSLFGTWGN